MSSTTPTLSAVDNEIVDIQREMRHIEGTVERPPTPPHHHADPSHRSDVTASTTHYLPMEILSLIFQHSSPPLHHFTDAFEKKHLAHLTLRSVSSWWHHVVQSTPQLWTCVTSVRKCVDEDFARYLKLCLDNSGRLPLAIYLSFHVSHATSPYLVSPLVDDALRCNLYGIRILLLLDANNLWLAVIPLMFELTSLWLMGVETDASGGPSSSISLLDLSKNTKINHLSLSHLFTDNFKLGPSASLVTQLDLHFIPIDICIRLYLECQHVNDLRCSSLIQPQSSLVPRSPIHNLERDSLISLSWELWGDALIHWSDYILKWARFPALKSLWWTDIGYPNTVYDRTGFFSRLPRSLKILGFSHIRPSVVLQDILIDHMRPDSNVSKIVLNGCNECFLVSIFQSLFKKTTADGGEVVPFPRLVCISADIFIFDYSRGVGSTIGENLVRLLEERKNVINEFTFHYPGNFKGWKAETLRRLDELKVAGLTINILRT